MKRIAFFWHNIAIFMLVSLFGMKCILIASKVDNKQSKSSMFYFLILGFVSMLAHLISIGISLFAIQFNGDDQKKEIECLDSIYMKFFLIVNVYTLNGHFLFQPEHIIFH